MHICILQNISIEIWNGHEEEAYNDWLEEKAWHGDNSPPRLIEELNKK